MTLMAGGHCSTNMYIAPSNSACTAPRSRMRGSLLMTLTAADMLFELFSAVAVAAAAVSPLSLLLLLLAAVDLGATFSLQLNIASKLPRERKRTLSVKGPVGPSFAAVSAASCPARMATNESPA